MKDESTVQQDLQLYSRHNNCNLMRNNCGAFKDETGRTIRFGLNNISKKHQENSASSDLIGITQVKITSDMVGQTIGVFTAVECKKEAWNHKKKFDTREQAQSNFIKWVKSLGGFAGFANKLDDIDKILKQ